MRNEGQLQTKIQLLKSLRWRTAIDRNVSVILSLIGSVSADNSIVADNSNKQIQEGDSGENA